MLPLHPARWHYVMLVREQLRDGKGKTNGDTSYMVPLHDIWEIKRLRKKELTSKPISLSLNGLDELSPSLLKTAGTIADKN